MSLINREVLLAEYDRVHVGEPGKARKLIEDATTVEPERKKGKWIDDKGYVVEMRDGSPIRECWCSECGEWLIASDEYAVKGNFCPNCGADMRENTDAV